MDWSLIWTAIGGIAQAVAAEATFLAVLVALRLGKREDRRSLQARYDDARPVLIIVSDPKSIPVEQGNESYLDWSKQPNVDVRNVGNGPALSIRSVIYRPEAIAMADPSTIHSGVTWKYLSGVCRLLQPASIGLAVFHDSRQGRSGVSTMKCDLFVRIRSCNVRAL